MNQVKRKVCAIILAAGNGSRMKSNITKQRMTIRGKSVLLHCALAFQKSKLVDYIVVVAREDETDFVENELKDKISKLKKITVGGKTRAESAKIGFFSIPEDTGLVLIHDAARCLITDSMIDKVINCAKEKGAATATSLVTDTVKTVDGMGRIISTLDRNKLRKATTPQAFDVEIYRKALHSVSNFDNITDDNMLVEKIGIPIYCVDIGIENIKITTKEDLKYAEFLISQEDYNV